MDVVEVDGHSAQPSSRQSGIPTSCSNKGGPGYRLRINDAGTLLSNDPTTSPIVAMHELIQLGAGVTWDQGGICIKVPKFGLLPAIGYRMSGSSRSFGLATHR